MRSTDSITDYLFDDSHPAVLDEDFYRQMLDEDDFKHLIGRITHNNVPGAILHNLPVKDWSPLIKQVDYVGFKGSTMKLFCPNKYNGWNIFFQFDDFIEQSSDMSLKATEVARLLLWAGNIRMHCPCPSYAFWGFKYVATQHNSSIYPENRYPHIKNPNLRGIACKHLIRGLKTLPFRLGPLASAVNEYRKENGLKK